jgi:hypothetical protein
MRQTYSDDQSQNKEIKINPTIILEMAEKYKIPVNPSKAKA